MEDQQPTSTPSNDAQGQDQCVKCEEYLAGWKRAQADYANLKKETERERVEFAKYANERLLQELLPAIDQYETALKFTPDVSVLPDDMRKKLENWIAGLKAVQSLWEGSFRSIGLEKVPTTGAFDPQIHEAVGHEAAPDIPKDHVMRVMQDGWRLHGKLLRPAKVIVAESQSDEQ